MTLDSHIKIQPKNMNRKDNKIWLTYNPNTGKVGVQVTRCFVFPWQRPVSLCERIFRPMWWCEHDLQGKKCSSTLLQWQWSMSNDSKFYHPSATASFLICWVEHLLWKLKHMFRVTILKIQATQWELNATKHSTAFNTCIQISHLTPFALRSSISSHSDLWASMLGLCIHCGGPV